MDRLVTDDREFVRARRDKNEDGVAFGHFMHPKPVKFFLCGDERIDIQLAALNENANLTRRS